MVVAYSLDRISRNIVDGSLLDDLLEANGALILYATQAFTNDANGRFVKNIMRAVAQVEPEETAERTIKNQLKKAQKCEFNGGRIPYGFDIIGKEYVIKDEEAEAVKIMFECALLGQNIPEIIDTLTQTGYFTRENKPFSPQTVYRMLRSVKYKGTYLYNEEGGKKSSKGVLKGDYDEVRIANGIPQIVDEETFDKVQALLGNTTTKKNTNNVSSYILTGLLKCGCCGNSMHGYASIGGRCKKRYTNYTCRGGKSRNACGLLIRQEYIERATAILVSNVLEEKRNDKKISKSLFAKIKANLRKEFNTLKNEVVAKEREINKKIEALSNSKNALVSEIITAQIQKLSEIKKVKEKRKEELSEQINKVDDVVKKYLSGELKIDAVDIMNNDKVFKGLATLIIKDITITKDEITFSLNDLSK